MVTKITRLLIVALIVAIAIAIIYLNSGDSTVYYGPEAGVTMMSGVIYLGWFALGLAASLFFWVLYGVKTYFRERSLKAEGQRSKDFYKALLEARSLLAAQESNRAEDRWRKLIKRDPTDIIARVELSRSLEQGGDQKEALKVLDKARATDPSNVEVLLRAAELHLACGNKTAAIDNLALVLYQDPNAYAAELARNLSEDLGRIEDAIEYNKKYETLSGHYDEEVTNRLRFKQLMEQEGELSDTELLKRLRKLVSSTRSSCAEAVQRLAELEERSGNTSEAAEVLVRAAKENHSRELWRQAMELWLSHGDMERAIAAAKTAIRSASNDEERIDATLDVARLTLSAGQKEEALSHLDGLATLIEGLSVQDSENIERRRSFLALRGAAFSSLERHGDAKELWEQLSLDMSPFGKGNAQVLIGGATQKALPAPGTNGSVKSQPSPELSTP